MTRQIGAKQQALYLWKRPTYGARTYNRCGWPCPRAFPDERKLSYLEQALDLIEAKARKK